jgi:hypothetical protein
MCFRARNCKGKKRENGMSPMVGKGPRIVEHGGEKTCDATFPIIGKRISGPFQSLEILESRLVPLRQKRADDFPVFVEKTK